jgi:hypothetical protein
MRVDGDNASVPLGLVSSQTFESSGTYTKPSNIRLIRVYVTGAGGGTSVNAGSAYVTGGAGGTCIAIIDAQSISSVSVTIGDGGRGDSSTTSGPGGTSSFGSFVSATGGGGGDENQPFRGGEGGIGTGSVGGDVLSVFNIKGSGGIRNGGANNQASGANSFWGAAGTGQHDRGGNDNGRAAAGYGASSGGAAIVGGDNGGDGVVYIEEYE